MKRDTATVLIPSNKYRFKEIVDSIIELKPEKKISFLVVRIVSEGPEYLLISNFITLSFLDKIDFALFQ